MIRNQLMLDQGVDLVLAFVKDWDSSPGTRDMMRRAIDAGVTVVAFGDERAQEWVERAGPKPSREEVVQQVLALERDLRG